MYVFPKRITHIADKTDEKWKFKNLEGCHHPSVRIYRGVIGRCSNNYTVPRDARISNFNFFKIFSSRFPDSVSIYETQYYTTNEPNVRVNRGETTEMHVARTKNGARVNVGVVVAAVVSVFQSVGANLFHDMADAKQQTMRTIIIIFFLFNIIPVMGIPPMYYY